MPHPLPSTAAPFHNPALLAKLLDALGVIEPAQRELFERLIDTQERRRIPSTSAEWAITQAFDYHASLAEHALGVVDALQGGAAAPPGGPSRYDEAALSIGLASVGAWADLLTCAPLRHAARLVLTPPQQSLLQWLVNRIDPPGRRGRADMDQSDAGGSARDVALEHRGPNSARGPGVCEWRNR